MKSQIASFSLDAATLPRTVALLFATALLLSSCGLESKDTALGENDVIVIVADSLDYLELEDVVENAFLRPVFTPQAESWFRIERYDLKDLLNLKRKRNILIVSPVDADNSMGEYMRSALDSNVQALVENGEEYVFVQRDPWYRGQTVMHLTGRSMTDLRDYMATNAEKLHYYFKQAWDQQEKERMLRLSREEEIEQRMMENYGWTICAIKGWFVGKDSSAMNTVLLRRQNPHGSERWIMVHWINTRNTSILTNEFAFDTRNRLTEVLYRTFDDSAWVEVDTINHLQFDEVDFDGKFAIRMKGLWHLSDYSMGGPFISNLFYDEEQQRIYFLDGSVFAPKYEKKKLIQDVDVMLRTLQLGSLKHDDGDSK